MPMNSNTDYLINRPEAPEPYKPFNWEEHAVKFVPEVHEQEVSKYKELPNDTTTRLINYKSNYNNVLKNLDKKGVKNFQRFLNEQGASLIEDGIIGPKTRKQYKLYINKKNNRNFDNINIDTLAGCAAYVREAMQQAFSVNPVSIGAVSNAWQMPQLVLKSGGESIYNIYDNVAFKGIKNKENLKRVTEKVIKDNPIDYSKLQVGDIVGIYMPSSKYHDIALKEGTTYNTHIGVIAGYDADGTPMVRHFIKGAKQPVRYDRADKLSGSAYGKAKIATVTRPNQQRLSLASIGDFNYGKTSRFTFPEEAENPNYGMTNTIKVNNPILRKYAAGVESAFDVYQKLFNIDPKTLNELAKRSISVQQRETNLLNNIESKEPSMLAQIIYRAGTGKELTNEETKSTAHGKLKLGSFDKNERNFLGIHSKEDLEKPDNAGRAAFYILCKAYSAMRDVMEAYPDLGLTNDLITQIAPIAFQQGDSKLRTIGFDSKGRYAPEEVEFWKRSLQSTPVSPKLKDLDGRRFFNMAAKHQTEVFQNPSSYALKYLNIVPMTLGLGALFYDWVKYNFNIGSRKATKTPKYTYLFSANNPKVLERIQEKPKNNKNAYGGDIGNDYNKWIEEIRKLKNIDISNDPTYDYERFYYENPELAKKMLHKDSNAHFIDKYKTSLHPTFSDESIYSGYKNVHNPSGVTGGHWVNDNAYVLSEDQLYNDWDTDKTLKYYKENESNGAVFDPYGGIVLPSVVITPKKDIIDALINGSTEKKKEQSLIEK